MTKGGRKCCVQRPTSNKTKNSNRNQKETEGRLTAAPSRAYYYNILGNMKVPLEEYPQTLGNFILIVPNSIQLGMLQETTTLFCLSKHGLSELAQSALWLKLAVMEAHTRTGALLITSACGLARVSSFCLITIQQPFQY